MARFIQVEVGVTTTLTFRIPRPTKAEIVENCGPDAWDPDCPEDSIRDYIEGEGLEGFIKGVRPTECTVDEMELFEVLPG